MAISRKGLFCDFDRMAQFGWLDPLLPLTRAGTGSVVNVAGVLGSVASGIPRFNRAAIGALKAGLLVESQRTNLVTNSNVFSGWGLLSFSASGTAAGPDGGSTSAGKFIPVGASDWVMYGPNFTVAAGQVVGSLWLYVESSVATNVTCWLDVAGGANTQSFSVPPNVWTRVQAQANGSSGNAFLKLVIPASGNTKPTSVRLFGCQIEQGEGATSLIPTSGAAATRLADSLASINGAAASLGVRPDMGTILVDFTPHETSTVSGRTINNGYLHLTPAGGNTGTPGLHLWRWGYTNSLQFNIGNSSNSNLHASGLVASMIPYTRLRVVVSWIGTTLQVAMNGVLLQTDVVLSGPMPAFDKLSIGHNGTGSDVSGAVFHEVKILPFGVTSAVAKALSSTASAPL
jgi:hypothetical protein